LNLVSVRYFGIAEFYLSIFKVILIIGLLFFTFITMLGGNPLHDRYGFRYWNHPGAFVEHLVPGSTGRFLGILSCIVQATFSICGPEYVSMVAGETKAPRKVLPKAFRSFVWRILLFFCASALAMGIVIPYDDKTLNAVLVGDISGSGTGAASPYVIAMQRLQISGLPHVVNAGIMTSVLSAGNGLLFSATRTLYGMSKEGTAPKFFSKTLKSGVPVYCVLASLSVGLLAFLQTSNSSAKVLTWLVYLITACQLLNYFATALTYRHFYSALKHQGVDRNTLPYKGKFQPYTSYIAMFFTALMLFLLGYDLFITGGWDILYFFLDYTFLAVFPLAVVFWKVVKRTKYVKPGTADLTVDGMVPAIDQYERSTAEETNGKVEGLLDRFFNGQSETKG
jgi:yeast amino acid transporter